MNRFVAFFRNLPFHLSAGVIIFWVAAVALAGGFFIFARDFVTCWQFTTLDGIPPASCNVESAGIGTPALNAKGTPIAATPTVDVSAPVVQAPTWDGGSRINVVFFGLRGGATSGEDCPDCTDTIILFTVDPVSKTAAMISIPRDLWVNIPGVGFSRINTAWTDGEGSKLPGGGPGLAMQTVSQLIGVPIQYYAQVNFDTFVAFINTIGGIDIRPYENLRLDPLGNGKDKFILTKGGIRHIDGEVALAYARCRDQDQCGAQGGDLDRSKRQQQVILAIRSKVLDPANFPTLIAKAPWFYTTFGGGIHTNMSLDDAIKLAYLMKDIPLSQIKNVVFDYTDMTIASTTLGGQAASVFKPIPDKVELLRDEVFTTSGPISPMAQGDPIALMQADKASVGVLNGTYATNLEQRTAVYFSSLGLKIAGTGRASQLYGQTTVYMCSSKLYTLRYLIARQVITSGNQVSFNQSQCKSYPGVDIIVVLGSDWIPKLPTGF
ncbi:MAG TPA: LCP family protein [Anaerolineales bacterium]|nr:LCP family protein [Anaerolineales bacterium]